MDGAFSDFDAEDQELAEIVLAFLWLGEDKGRTMAESVDRARTLVDLAARIHRGERIAVTRPNGQHVEFLGRPEGYAKFIGARH